MEAGHHSIKIYPRKTNHLILNSAMEALGLLFHLLLLGLLVHAELNFTYKGFLKANVTTEGASFIKSDGILALTNDSVRLIGHSFYPSPIRFKNSNPNRTEAAVTFSTNFVFSISPKYPEIGGHGLAFVLMPTEKLKSLPNQYLGLPNDTDNARFFAVEFYVVQNVELQDINDNHVGIDISSLISNISEPAAYYSSNDNRSNSVALKSGEPIQAWIDYDSNKMLMNVSISPCGTLRPHRPLISFPIDLSLVLDEYMYVGFSASTGLLAALHYVHGWSFSIEGRAQDLDPRKLPFLNSKPNKLMHSKGFAVGITLASITLIFLAIIGVIQIIFRIRDGDEIMEDWEIEYRVHRFNYSELFSATRGFGEKNLVSSGGFGRVYRGVIRGTGLEVAVKRVYSGSRQGMREFVAEITSVGRLRHRNLVHLHGWCRKQNELLLVYDYFPNGSLDKLLYEDGPLKGKNLTWDQRYKILTGIAHALLYLHENCNQRVVHRDVKPSNTTHIVGTLGYLAPELTRTGKATTSTDVYGYGGADELVLVDWVRELHSRGEITRAIDPTLKNYHSGEAQLVLTLGLLCCHPHPDYRPTMRRVVQLLLGDATLPPLPHDIHMEVPIAITEYSDTFGDDSDNPSSQKMPSSSSKNSWTIGHTTRVTF
ncbi:hypothetical protein ES332_A03G204500v1 [Gossypium tomentosum]|uniref:non-specific serine/threonine protein kinase n=1 Tax=Gossypium tomentosum TaxID=34277 RepID=A0A5D2RBW0_GOSTO|nr:hypothetical protein ES332_A03G204500v1 [Gossypium tomentosum]